MRRSLCVLFVALLALVPPGLFAAAPFAIAVVQSATTFGSAPTMTWTVAPSASNTIVMIVQMENEAQTISVGGWTPSVTTLAGPIDSAISTFRGYIFCTVGDGADTTMLPVASSNAVIFAIAVEVSGAESCASITRDTEFGDNSAVTAHVLGTALTATAGDFIYAQVLAVNGANFTHDAGFTDSVPTGDVEVNTQALAQYLLSSAGGSQDAPFSSSTTETTQLLAVALIPASGGGPPPCQSRSLMGVGCL